MLTWPGRGRPEIKVKYENCQYIISPRREQIFICISVHGVARPGLCPSQLSCSVASNVSRIVVSMSPGDTQPAQTAQGTLTSPPGFTVYLPTCNILTWLFANSKLKECLSLSILTAQWENTGCQEVIFNNFPVDVFQSEFWFWILTLAIKSWKSALVVNMIKENK